MKFLISLILLGLSGRALAGGDTNCGSLQANFLVLLQNFLIQDINSSMTTTIVVIVS